MKKLIRFLVLILIVALFALLCQACGVNYHLKRAERHIEKAKAKGAKIASDTTYATVDVKMPGISVKFEPQVVSHTPDTVYFEKDRLKVKLMIKRDTVNKVDTLYAEADCPDALVKKDVPVAVNQAIECEGQVKWWQLSLYIAGAFAVGYVFRAIFK